MQHVPVIGGEHDDPARLGGRVEQPRQRSQRGEVPAAPASGRPARWSSTEFTTTPTTRWSGSATPARNLVGQRHAARGDERRPCGTAPAAGRCDAARSAGCAAKPARSSSCPPTSPPASSDVRLTSVTVGQAATPTGQRVRSPACRRPALRGAGRGAASCATGSPMPSHTTSSTGAAAATGTTTSRICSTGTMRGRRPARSVDHSASSSTNGRSHRSRCWPRRRRAAPCRQRRAREPGRPRRAAAGLVDPCTVGRVPAAADAKVDGGVAGGSSATDAAAGRRPRPSRHDGSGAGVPMLAHPVQSVRARRRGPGVRAHGQRRRAARRSPAGARRRGRRVRARRLGKQRSAAVEHRRGAGRRRGPRSRPRPSLRQRARRAGRGRRRLRTGPGDGLRLARPASSVAAHSTWATRPRARRSAPRPVGEQVDEHGNRRGVPAGPPPASARPPLGGELGQRVRRPPAWSPSASTPGSPSGGSVRPRRASLPRPPRQSASSTPPERLALEPSVRRGRAR